MKEKYAGRDPHSIKQSLEREGGPNGVKESSLSHI